MAEKTQTEDKAETKATNKRQKAVAAWHDADTVAKKKAALAEHPELAQIYSEAASLTH